MSVLGRWWGPDNDEVSIMEGPVFTNATAETRWRGRGPEEEEEVGRRETGAEEEGVGKDLVEDEDEIWMCSTKVNEVSLFTRH